MEALRARFFDKVEQPANGASCWIWTAAISIGGYGRIAIHSKGRSAHRVAWELLRGEIPDGEGHHGICVLHRCDNRRCVNPDHLFLGTQSDNIRDMAEKGRKVNPESLVTHCPQGHEYTATNTYRWRNQRNCIACRRARMAIWYRQQRKVA